MAKKYKLTDLENAKQSGLEENEWLITLSDMMMLLLTFFVMLFVIIEPSNQDYVGTLRKIGDALGGKSLAERKQDPSVLTDKLDSLIKDNNLVKQVHLTTDARGIVLFAEGDIVFKPGTAQLTKNIEILLNHVAGIIKQTQYKVIVEGHTDNVPTKGGKYPTNWELSTARASAVVRYFVENMKMDPRRFSAAGYAEYKPRYALVPENRPRNRRVEIVILREEI